MLFSAVDDLVWTKFKQKRQQVSNISIKKPLLFKELCSSGFFYLAFLLQNHSFDIRHSYLGDTH